MNSIGKKILTERQRRNISQRALAIKSGISNATISRIEAEEVTPDIDTLTRLSAALQLDMTYMLDTEVAEDIKHLPNLNDKVVTIARGGTVKTFEVNDEEADAIENIFNNIMKKQPKNNNEL